jgi:hypothetical protein
MPIILFSLHGEDLKGGPARLKSLGISAVVSKSEPIERLLAEAHRHMKSD